MAALFQLPYLLGLPLLPSRRLIAIDAGSHSIKILLVERAAKTLRILRREIIDLHEEGLLSAEEIGPALHSVLKDVGDHPIALALPGHLAQSQILDLSAGAKAVKQLIEAETYKNRDLRDSPVVYDCARLQPFGKHQNSFLVTLCKESDILGQISGLALPKEDVCEVVAAGNVLATAYQTTNQPLGNVLLVDIGASGTLVTICVGGQAVHSAHFPIGGNLFTETIAAKNNCSVEAAEVLKQTKNLLSGPDEIPALAPVFQAWQDELKRVLEGWLRENTELSLAGSSFKAILSGGGAAQPGLLAFLNNSVGLEFQLWPRTIATDSEPLPEQFATAFGTALQALGAGTHSASLLPGELREEWRNRRIHQYLLTGILAVLTATMLLLLIGTWKSYSDSKRKESLLAQSAIALDKAEQMAALRRQLADSYERLRPVFKKQRQTLDTLKTLALLEQTRTNRNLWYVLFADDLSYISGPASNAVPTRFGLTAASTNTALRSGFVAELCINQEGEAMRQTLFQVVSELKQSAVFSNVDAVPSDLRRDLAKTNVILPGRHFALSLEIQGADFPPAIEKAVVTNTTVSGSAGKGNNRSNINK